MAPQMFWLKRQLPGINLPGPLGGLDLNDDEPIVPRPSSSTGTTASSTGSAAQNTVLGSSSVPRNTSSATSASTTASQTSSTSSASVVSNANDEDPTPVTLPQVVSTSGAVETPAPLLTSSSPSQFISTAIQNTTLVVDGPANTGSPSNVGAARNSNSFLENKVLSGVVFGLCGLVGLILIIVAIFFFTRRARRNRKLEKEIISWDPDHVQSFNNNSSSSIKDSDARSFDDLEKGSLSRAPSSHNHYAYTLPSNTYTGPNNPTQYQNYGAQRPIHVALPTSGAQQRPTVPIIGRREP